MNKYLELGDVNTLQPLHTTFVPAIFATIPTSEVQMRVEYAVALPPPHTTIPLPALTSQHADARSLQT
jgi:hypothetical protein